MMQIASYILYGINFLLIAYAIYTVSYTFLNSLAALFMPIKKFANPESYKKFVVFIPAYKEDGVIVSVAQNALKQTYNNDFYDVVVIADSLQEKTLDKLRQLPIKTIEVSFENSTKVKALNAAMEKLGDDYDVALILDADNIMDEDCIMLMNAAFSAGHKSVQGKRTAKNKNSSFAILDGVSEHINNHIYRKGQNALGFSSSLIGSGMAFDYKVFKKTLAGMTSIGGFDRELEVKLLEQGIKTIYYEDAVVYDEKVDNPQSFGKQRTRWIAAQYLYLFKYFFKGMSALFAGKISYFNSSILRNIQLPRIINLGLLGLWTFVVIIFNEFFAETLWFWVVAYSVYLSAFIIAIPIKSYNKDFFISLLKLPQAFFIMLLCFFKLKTAKDKFIHTPHNYVELEKAEQ